MNDDGSKNAGGANSGQPRQISAREAERARLAAALRANLKRRKVQARARRDSDAGGDGTADD